MKKFIKLWMPVLVWLGLIFIGSSIGNVPQVGDETTDGLAHRVAHVLEFAMLGGLLLRALNKGKTITKREVISVMIISGLYGASDELHQRFTPGRSSEGLSVLFDVAGSALGVWIYRWWKQRTAKARPDIASREPHTLESR